MKQKYIPFLAIRPAVFIMLLSMIAIFSCKESSGSKSAVKAEDDKSGIPADLGRMVMEDIPGTDTKHARQMTSSGYVEIEGYLRNNQKTGQWILYTQEGDVSLINNYVDGKLEGVSLHMAYRNQVDQKSNYRNGILHGPWIGYKFGKIVEERNYNNGQLDGTVKIYDERTFKLKQEAEYKDGLQDGFFRYYDENGNVTLEYEYKKGEKISGGMKTK